MRSAKTDPWLSANENWCGRGRGLFGTGGAGGLERGDRGDWRVAGFELVDVDDGRLVAVVVVAVVVGAVVVVAPAAAEIWNSVSISVDLGLCDEYERRFCSTVADPFSFL